MSRCHSMSERQGRQKVGLLRKDDGGPRFYVRSLSMPASSI